MSPIHQWGMTGSMPPPPLFLSPDRGRWREFTVYQTREVGEVCAVEKLVVTGSGLLIMCFTPHTSSCNTSCTSPGGEEEEEEGG